MAVVGSSASTVVCEGCITLLWPYYCGPAPTAASLPKPFAPFFYPAASLQNLTEAMVHYSNIHCFSFFIQTHVADRFRTLGPVLCTGMKKAKLRNHGVPWVVTAELLLRCGASNHLESASAHRPTPANAKYACIKCSNHGVIKVDAVAGPSSSCQDMQWSEHLWVHRFYFMCIYLFHIHFTPYLRWRSLLLL